MKNRMKLRKSIGKISTFLRTVKGKSSKTTSSRRNRRNPNPIPNSTKVGAGTDRTSKVIRSFIFSPSVQKRKKKEKQHNLKHISKVI